MAWVAYDRAIKSAAETGMKGPWRSGKRAAAIHDEVCRRGYDEERQTFVQIYGKPQHDVSLLWTRGVGFLAPKDPRVAKPHGEASAAVGRTDLQSLQRSEYEAGCGLSGSPEDA
jgi:hypothetical protein